MLEEQNVILIARIAWENWRWYQDISPKASGSFGNIYHLDLESGSEIKHGKVVGPIMRTIELNMKDDE